MAAEFNGISFDDLRTLEKNLLRHVEEALGWRVLKVGEDNAIKWGAREKVSSFQVVTNVIPRHLQFYIAKETFDYVVTDSADSFNNALDGALAKMHTRGIDGVSLRRIYDDHRLVTDSFAPMGKDHYVSIKYNKEK